MNLDTNLLICGLIMLLGWATVFAHETPSERQARLDRRRMIYPAPGMDKAFLKIIEELYHEKTNAEHLPAISNYIKNFKTCFEYNRDFFSHYELLLQQYRLVSEQAQPEEAIDPLPKGPLCVTASGEMALVA